MPGVSHMVSAHCIMTNLASENLALIVGRTVTSGLPYLSCVLVAARVIDTVTSHGLSSVDLVTVTFSEPAMRKLFSLAMSS